MRGRDKDEPQGPAVRARRLPRGRGPAPAGRARLVPRGLRPAALRGDRRGDAPGGPGRRHRTPPRGAGREHHPDHVAQRSGGRPGTRAPPISVRWRSPARSWAKTCRSTSTCSSTRPRGPPPPPHGTRTAPTGWTCRTGGRLRAGSPSTRPPSTTAACGSCPGPTGGRSGPTALPDRGGPRVRRAGVGGGGGAAGSRIVHLPCRGHPPPQPRKHDGRPSPGPDRQRPPPGHGRARAQPGIRPRQERPGARESERRNAVAPAPREPLHRHGGARRLGVRSRKGGRTDEDGAPVVRGGRSAARGDRHERRGPGRELLEHPVRSGGSAPRRTGDRQQPRPHRHLLQSGRPRPGGRDDLPALDRVLPGRDVHHPGEQRPRRSSKRPRLVSARPRPWWPAPCPAAGWEKAPGWRGPS